MTSSNTSTSHRIAPADHEGILGHYHLAAPLIAAHFGGTPLVYATAPRGLGGIIEWHGVLRATPPARLPTVDVPTAEGIHTYLAVRLETISWLLAHTAVVEFHGWGCTAVDPRRVGFARILLELDKSHRGVVQRAATTLRELLLKANLQAIPLLQGTRGIALWIPLAGGPPYPDVRGWLRSFCALAAIQYPDLFTLEPNAHVAGRVHLHVGSNAPGRYSALPYSLRKDVELRICAPLTWEELPQLHEGDLTAETFPARLANVGDVFATQLGRIGAQSLPEGLPDTAAVGPSHRKPIEPHGHILHAAETVLADGQSRDAATILKEALARHLVAPETQESYVYTSLIEYIVRTSGHGHQPLIIQQADRRFRLNVPEDDWPRFDLPATPAPDAQTQAIVDRLSATSHGDGPRGFEIAVCDAFAHLGFVATHVGGNDNPDGYADAPLGALGYRAMIECKTSRRAVHKPDAVEAVKFKDDYGAQYCAMVGTVFAEDLELASELGTHAISAFTIDDLQQLLRIGSNPHEMRPLFAPGFVADRIGNFLWERTHGAAKRVALICRYLRDAGWHAQVAFANANRDNGTVADAPRLTVDAAMLLVDQRLADEGSQATCSRAEVSAAFAHLTNPLVGMAVWLDDHRDAIAIVRAPTDALP